MKSYKYTLTYPALFVLATFVLYSCKDQGKNTQEIPEQVSQSPITKLPKKQLSKEFKDYWYSGKAEITSYSLEQARYGELRNGNAVLIYVTEPFLPQIQVKADKKNVDNVPVLKLNSTKNYLTGIYPYSIMTSSFYPVHDNQHALKVSFSSQEWCGQVYAQLNNKDDFEIMSHSYFENEADQNLKLAKTHLENEIWNKIRINPTTLPTGSFKMVPSMEYIRLTHKKLQAYSAEASISTSSDTTVYTITYPDLERTLKIHFTATFPYTIEGWTDTYKGGFGQEAKVLTSTATIINRITTPYWKQNSNKDLSLRDSLGL
ncbi:septum formation inhibitor Maf [Maribacter sp. LLG6340-A2]|uniref:septum formation inhibitor Maf n=1 Tax=Maribacter sp. LLG6340-A2 TaxID=3160834 RepID=UPI0038692CEA